MIETLSYRVTILSISEKIDRVIKTPRCIISSWQTRVTHAIYDWSSASEVGLKNGILNDIALLHKLPGFSIGYFLYIVGLLKFCLI